MRTDSRDNAVGDGSSRVRATYIVNAQNVCSTQNRRCIGRQRRIFDRIICAGCLREPVAQKALARQPNQQRKPQ